MWKAFLPIAGVIIAASVGVSLGARDALALQVDTEFDYSGTGTTTATIFDGNTDAIDLPDVLDLGKVTLGATIAVDLENKLQPFADVQIVAPDGGVVEGETLPVTLKLVSKDGSVKEFVLNAGLTFAVRFGYDDNEDGLNCGPFPVTGGDGSDDTCQEYDLADLVGLGSINLFDADMTAPYKGGTFAPPEQSTTIASIPVCSLLVGLDVCSVDIIGTMNSLLSATEGPGGGPTPAVTDAGFHSDRSLLVGANEGPKTTIDFLNGNQVVDNVQIACGGSPGSSVSYKLSDNSYDARLTELTFGIDLLIAIQDPVPDIGPFNLFNVNVLPLFDHPLNVFAGAPDYQVTLGTYQAEQVPPTITSVATNPASGVGKEGEQINFTATAEDNCTDAAGLTYRWDFSDGGVAFGSNVYHTFNDNKTYSYQVTVCDARHNCATADPNYMTINQNPIANAGPDAIEAWGIAIPFNGQAVDPGADDQGTLSYEWDFGDNSPKGHALNVTHAYVSPGSYIATLKVCDKDGGCDTDTRDITVRKRTTSLGYLGEHSWTYDTLTHLTASLVDEFGQPVNGRQIDFTVGGAAAGNSSTSSSGIADRSYQVLEVAGAVTVDASFAGDPLYEGQSASAGVNVSVKATSLVYAGALKGGPNKTVTLSAVLRDIEGKPLAGQEIVFTLGDQTVTAITDTNGVAVASLKLDQKNGTYPLTATFDPVSNGVNDKYASSADIATFKLQTK